MSTANIDAHNLSQNALNGVINEDVMQRLMDVSDVEMTFLDLIGTSRHTNKEFSWTLDRLQPPDSANAHVDGSDPASYDADNQNTNIRVYNHSQISRKNVTTSTRSQAVNTIGFANSLAYQVSRRALELRRTINRLAAGNFTAVAGTDTVAGIAATMESWLADADVLGTATDFTQSVASAGAPVVGGWANRTGNLVPAINYAGVTAGALTETAIKALLPVARKKGVRPTVGLTTTEVMQKWSEYQFTSSARISTLLAERDGAVDRVAQGAVNQFHTDYGFTISMRDDPLMANGAAGDTLFVFDPSMVELSFLTGFTTEPRAKTGLADKREIYADWSFKALNYEALFAVLAIDNTLDMAA